MRENLNNNCEKKIRTRSYQKASLCIERTIGDRFNIILWAVPVSRRAAGSSENIGDENKSKAFWRRRFFFYFCQNLEGWSPPPLPITTVLTTLRGIELRGTTSDWQKRIEAIATQSTVMSAFFSNEVSFFPRFKYHFFLYTISFFSYRKKRNASKILIFQPLLLYVWAKFSKFKLIVLS